MLFAVFYLVMAGIGAWLLSTVLGRSARPLLGLAYLRAALFASAGLMLIDIVGYLVFGVWWMPPVVAVAMGFVLPGVMLAIT